MWVSKDLHQKFNSQIILHVAIPSERWMLHYYLRLAFNSSTYAHLSLCLAQGEAKYCICLNTTHILLLFL